MVRRTLVLRLAAVVLLLRPRSVGWRCKKIVLLLLHTVRCGHVAQENVVADDLCKRSTGGGVIEEGADKEVEYRKGQCC